MRDSTRALAPARTVPRPRWSGLYGLVVLALGTLASVEVLARSATWRMACECAVVLGAFGGMAMWTRRNRVALDLRERRDCAAGTITVRMISSRSRTRAVRVVALTSNHDSGPDRVDHAGEPRALRSRPSPRTGRTAGADPSRLLTRRRAGNLPRPR